MKKKILISLLLAAVVAGAGLAFGTIPGVKAAEPTPVEKFSAKTTFVDRFDVLGDSGMSLDSGYRFSASGEAMILSKVDDFTDFTLDLSYEILDEQKGQPNNEVGVLIRAKNQAGDGLTGGLSGMLIGFEYDQYEELQVCIGNYFNGVFEKEGYWSAGWGRGFARRDIRIVVKGDVVAIIIGGWHAHVQLNKFFATGSVGVISKNVALEVNGINLSSAPDEIYGSVIREQWKGSNVIGTGKAFKNGQTHEFVMSLPSGVAEASAVTMYRRAEANSHASAVVKIDGETIGTWSGKDGDVKHDIPLDFVKGKDKIKFEITADDSENYFNSDYYILTYTTKNGEYVADSLDIGSAYDENNHAFKCGEAFWASFWQRFMNTSNRQLLSATPGAKVDYIMAPVITVSDITANEGETINLEDYVSIETSGFKIKYTYLFDGQSVESPVIGKIEKGEHSFGVKAEAVPWSEYSLSGAKGFDDVFAGGKITVGEGVSQSIEIGKDMYSDKVLGGWVGANWGIYAGLDTECQFNDRPNPATEIKWNIGKGYCTDDDTNVEYTFLHMMDVYGVNGVAYEDFRQEWETHCQDYIWCANLTARNLMSAGLMPPYTGSKEYNSNWNAIDAQIECELFGMIAPGMLRNTYDRTKWWLKSVGDGVAVENACYYAMMCSLSFVESDIEKIIGEVNRCIMVYSDAEAALTVSDANYVLELYKANKQAYETDKEAWRTVRKAICDDIYRNGSAVDARTNFCATIMSLLFGGGDIKETGRISVLAGWDNDCNAATALTIAGMIKGYAGLPEDFLAKNGNYYLNTRRPGLTDSTLEEITERIKGHAETVIADLGGVIGDDKYSVVDGPFVPVEYNTSKYVKKVGLLEDGWTSDGFSKVYNENLHYKKSFSASKAGASLEYVFSGKSVEVLALLSKNGGTVECFVDGKSYGEQTLKCDPASGVNGKIISVVGGQTIFKIRNLDEGEHVLKLVAKEAGKQHTIDYINVECTEEEWIEQNGSTVNLARTTGVAAICSVPVPGAQSGGNRSLSVINDGLYFTDFGNLKQQYDTFLGFDANGNLIDKTYEDFFGYTFDREYAFKKLKWQEGGHWQGGGWFANGSLRVEVKRGDEWVSVDFTLDKEYPDANDVSAFGQFGEWYTFTLKNAEKGTGIRIIGTPGGSQKLVSCAELEVYA